MKTILPIVLCLGLSACNSSDKELEFTDVKINSVTTSGAGCPSDSGASVTLAPDKTVVSVIFNEYLAEAGSGTGVTESRIPCNIAISLDIPSGYQTFLIDADFRGAVFLPEDGWAEFTREYFFSGESSPTLVDRWEGELENDGLQIFDRLEEYGGRLSHCGSDVILRSNTSLYISVPEGADTSLITLDSLDYTNRAQFDYQLRYVKCDI
ncbi:DUF4360 domain-containing protein [Leucothrix mucor]|uniref:DUF4360 domain-containing protein n=1 Tax=Leucothrix mucor TaxID=45248 RepID=UPI0003B606A2|nr:DUF4360 domain-containing protein [Leucothrix mucor]